MGVDPILDPDEGPTIMASNTPAPAVSPLFPGKITPDTLADLFAHHRARFGGYRMEGGDGGGSGDGGDNGSGGTGDGGGSGDGGDGDRGGKTDPPPPANGKTYTADDVTKAVEARVGELTRKHQRELQQAKDDAGKSDTQRIEAERDRAVERAESAAKVAAPKVAEALAQVAAITAGGRSDRAKAIVRQADLDGVAKFDGDDFTIDQTRLEDAIGKVLDEYPEWKADTGDGDDGKGKGGGSGDGGKGEREHSRSGGDLGGGTGSSDVTPEQFAKMGMGQRSELRQSDPETYRRLADKEVAAASERRGR